MLWFVLGVECSSTSFMNMDLLVEKADQISGYGEGDLTDSELGEGFWIMPGLQFTCSGNLTSLLLGIMVMADGTEYPSIELWRRTSMSSIEYERVPDTERYVTLDGSHFSTTGPYQYSITPPLPYDDGDVLAVRQPGDDAKVRLYQVDSVNQIYKVPYYHTANASSVKENRSQDVLISPITSKLIAAIYFYCIQNLFS